MWVPKCVSHKPSCRSPRVRHPALAPGSSGFVQASGLCLPSRGRRDHSSRTPGTSSPLRFSEALGSQLSPLYCSLRNSAADSTTELKASYLGLRLTVAVWFSNSWGRSPLRTFGSRGRTGWPFPRLALSRRVSRAPVAVWPLARVLCLEALVLLPDDLCKHEWWRDISKGWIWAKV